MLRHHHVADNLEFIFLPDLFKDLQEQVPARSGAKERSSLVTTTSDVVEIATSIPAAQSFGHGRNFISNVGREVESMQTHPLRRNLFGCVGWIRGPQRMGHPEC